MNEREATYYSNIGAHYDAKGIDDMNYQSSADGLIVHHHTGLFADGQTPVVADGSELLALLGRSEEALVHFGARLLDIQPGERGFDCGCGRGGSSFLFARDYGAQMTGITVSQKQYAFARDAASKLGLEASTTFFYENVYAHQRPADSFDFAWGCESIEYMRDRPGLFAEWRRVLRPGGRAVAIFMSFARHREAEIARDLEALFQIYAGQPDALDAFLSAAHGAGFRIEDFVALERETLPYWRLRLDSKVAHRGSEQHIIPGFESGAFHFSAVRFALDG